MVNKRRVWKYRGRRVPSRDLFYIHVHADELSYSLNYDTIFVYSYLFSNK